MKRTLVALLLVASSTGTAQAVSVNSVITDSVQLTVEGAAIQSSRVGSSYSVSGNNVTATSLGGLTGGTATAAPTIGSSTYAQTTAGQAFQFTESGLIGDTAVTAQAALSSGGRVDEPNLYSNSTTSNGGTAGTLAGTLTVGGVATVTAGGAGTTAIGQRTVELSVFR
jgi:hypothetical protein